MATTPPFGGTVSLGKAGLHTGSEGAIHSEAIVAAHVAGAPTASPGKAYVFTDKGRVPNPFRCFGGGPRRRPPRRRRGPPAENRHTPTFWTRFTPVCLDARVTHTYEAQGRNGEHRATLWSEKRSSPPTSRPSTLRSSLPPAGDAATPRGTRTSWTAPEPSPTCSAAGRPSKGLTPVRTQGGS
ncbi:hypothetical protein JCM4814A_00870 [Streptomyces phaeofaciens JCM 4814]|uniref:Uncharacterized protein n=1 Tax=Streptomyces phaeofaciens TaxID=68254 RepID=A0A918M167_9ACTN|nr:hypothetical protein GCM10010226_82710 [Streptomyces phaeofaciens]